MAHIRTILAATLILTLCACQTGEPSSKEMPYGIDQFDPEWYSCNLYDGSSRSAECASTKMPLFWESPDAEQIPIFAKRSPAPSGTIAAQLWLIDGGPGSPGAQRFGPFMEQLQLLNEDLEVLSIDHRGSGSSSYLDCNTPEGLDVRLIDQCASNLTQSLGESLKAYSTTMAAIDMAAYIETSRREDVPVYIWGGSYGTYLVQRYLQIFPDQAAGIILEGISPAVSSFIWSAEGVNNAAEEIFDICAQDEFCSAKFENDPLLAADDVFSRMEQEGHCRGLGINPSVVKNVLGHIMYSRPFNAFLPSLIYRLDRCNDADINVLMRMLSTFGGQSGRQSTINLGPGGNSTALYYNIVFSEMWEDPEFQSVNQMRSYLNEFIPDITFAPGVSYPMLDGYSIWPKYEDSYDDNWAKTETPMLMLQGELDPATAASRAEALNAHFSGPNQTYVSFATGAHSLLTGTPVGDSGSHCALELLLDFVDDPNQPVELACVSEVNELDFKGNPHMLGAYFGISDLWENEVEVVSFSNGDHLYYHDPFVDMALDDIRGRLAHLEVDGLR